MLHLRRVSIAFLLIFAASANNLMGQGASPAAISGEQIVERVSPSVVLILAGEGTGQTTSVGSGLVIRADGVILTAYHVVKGMKEVQVRLKNGEVYDQVQMIGFDERRDIAALRIPAVGLPILEMASSSSVPAGAPVFVVANGAGLPWTASSGILSAVRMAEEVPGAGSGYRLLQVTAPLSPGSSGGVLVDMQAQTLGIITGFLSVGQNVNFAVPLDSIAGLANASGGTTFSSGSRLQMPNATVAAAATPPARSAGVPSTPSPDLNLPPAEQRQIQTLSVVSKTIYIRRERLQDDLRKAGLFGQLGVRFADYGETADVAITVDRPFLTFEWTYTMVYQPGGLTLASGAIEGVDEFDAGPKLAAAIMEQLAAAVVLPRSSLASPRTAPAPDTQTQGPGNASATLETARTIFVESHTIWMKGNLLQDALYVRPELSQWGIRIVDDRTTADVYIDVTRPFLTYDWVYKMIHPRTGALMGTGKVTAIDGPAAAQRLAVDIVTRIRSVRPLPNR